MFYCSVLTGDYTTGTKGIRTAPVKHSKAQEWYDSACDDTTSPSTFIIFSDVQAFPSYLVICRRQFNSPCCHLDWSQSSKKRKPAIYESQSKGEPNTQQGRNKRKLVRPELLNNKILALIMINDKTISGEPENNGKRARDVPEIMDTGTSAVTKNEDKQMSDLQAIVSNEIESQENRMLYLPKSQIKRMPDIPKTEDKNAPDL